MSASSEFNKLFTKKSLLTIYESSVMYRTSVGIDRISKSKFEQNLPTNIAIIRNKCLDGSYKFSEYREKLIARGPNKFPRVISIPTIRDKLVLKTLNDLLHSVYNTSPFLHKIIFDVYRLLISNKFDSYLRLDVKDFYPSIDHQLLLKILSKRIRKKEILKLVQDAISKDTVSKPKKYSKKLNVAGVPQGLSISNKLANIYMTDLDEKYRKKRSIRYFRFVDDILILCNENKIQSTYEEIKNDLAQMNLTIHDLNDENSKTQHGNITSAFSYLGYKFELPNITVRQQSVERMRDSIIHTFTAYKYSDKKNLNHLKWSLDLRITGCIFNDTKYGWIFFFSQINDLTLLHSLDHFIKKQIDRFVEDPTKIKIKKFVKTYHEITKNLTNTKYVPNFDNYSTTHKRRILSDVFEIEGLLPNADIHYLFNKRIYTAIRDLEKDMVRLS